MKNLYFTILAGLSIYAAAESTVFSPEAQPIRYASGKITVKKISLHKSKAGVDGLETIVCVKEVKVPVFDLRSETGAPAVDHAVACDSTLGKKAATILVHSFLDIHRTKGAGGLGDSLKSVNAAMRVNFAGADESVDTFSPKFSTKDLNQRSFIVELHPMFDGVSCTNAEGNSPDCSIPKLEYFSTFIEIDDANL